MPEFTAQKVPVSSIYLNSDGSWKYPNDAKRYIPEYEFLFYKTEEDINGSEHRVVSRKMKYTKYTKYTKEGLKNKLERLIATRDQMNLDAVEEKEIIVISNMLKKIEELEK